MLTNLRHKISILNNIADNIEDEDWIEIYNCFAECKPMSETRYVEQAGIKFGHIISQEYYVFTIRYYPNVQKEMRIRFKTRLFNIRRVVNIKERNHSQHLIALEVQ